MDDSSNYNMSSSVLWLDWFVGGINPKYPGNGGSACFNFLSLTQRIVETIVFAGLDILLAIYAWHKLKLPKQTPIQAAEPLGKKVLLVVLCLTFGIEIGQKFATKTLIWLLNPCHLITAIQIYLLVAPPSKTVFFVFRYHMVMLCGAFLALAFPVVNSRQLPFETEVYWIQHILIYMVVPPYLMSLGGVYSTEPFSDFWWVLFSTACQFLYHFFPLQALGCLLEVNLNNMLCPAPSDPFYSKWYRVAAFVHQHLMVPVHGKLYVLLVQKLLSLAEMRSRLHVNGADKAE